MSKKEDLIQSILNIKRQIEKENNIKEAPEIKLGRRLEQRSNQKLSKEILEHIITSYNIDNNQLPTREKLIELMIKYLGNIQKTPNYYNLKNNYKEIYIRRRYDFKIGSGCNAKIYSFKPYNLKTKKKSKKLAYKDQKNGIPYNIDIHITSAILLAFYDFQPKYYNQYFMEIGQYDDKSKERSFQDIIRSSVETAKFVKNNIKWYILFNFTNIRDQVHNLMIRLINSEFLKIDIRSLNSEDMPYNIEVYLNYFRVFKKIFFKNRNIVINELNKILMIKEEFLYDLIVFRTKRGCFNIIDKEILAVHFDSISSSYKVKNLTDNYYIFSKTFKIYKNSYNGIFFEYNVALSWMLYYLWENNIIKHQKYIEFINKFNEKSKQFKEFALKIRNGEICDEKEKAEVIENQKKEEEIKIEINEGINEEINERIKEGIKEGDNMKIKIEINEDNYKDKKGELELEECLKKEEDIVKEEIRKVIYNKIIMLQKQNKENNIDKNENNKLLVPTKDENLDKDISSFIDSDNNNNITKLNIKEKNTDNNNDIYSTDNYIDTSKNRKESFIEIINLDNNKSNKKESFLNNEDININNDDYINKEIVYRKNNNFIHNIDKIKNNNILHNIGRIHKKKYKSLCCSCCSEDSVDVIDY